MGNSKSLPLLEVTDLKVSFDRPSFTKATLKNVSFSVYPNEIVAIVGESGSGKSITSLSVMGLLPKTISKITGGKIRFLENSLLELRPKELMSIRGKDIGIIFQEPMSALNPSQRCGKQVAEILFQHLICSKKSAKQKVLSLFEQVKLPDPSRIYSSYPHEISGGQKQRVMIAMAIACEPKLLIADEPTTALDVTVQKDIIELLKTLQSKTQMSMLFISHDLALVSEIADRVLVMYQGELVEQGTSQKIFKSPEQAYTKALIMARPSGSERLRRLPTVESIVNSSFVPTAISAQDREKFHVALYKQTPLLEVIDVSKYFFSKAGWFNKQKVFKAVKDVSFKVYPGETLGLVGESGCGKSTLSNAITLLTDTTDGKVLFNGINITDLNSSQQAQLRKDIQIIFQDPFASLNPRLSVKETLLEPMIVHHIGNSNEERLEQIKDVIIKVGLHRKDLNKYPHEFSGGQRQRIGIARAIILKPKLIICDESVSALDISVQAQVLNLLNDLKEDFGFTYIFISHDLNVVKYMSDNLLVMKDGRIEEQGEADTIYSSPHKEYTKKLIHAIPKGL